MMEYMKFIAELAQIEVEKNGTSYLEAIKIAIKQYFKILEGVYE